MLEHRTASLSEYELGILSDPVNDEAETPLHHAPHNNAQPNQHTAACTCTPRARKAWAWRLVKLAVLLLVVLLVVLGGHAASRHQRLKREGDNLGGNAVESRLDAARDSLGKGSLSYMIPAYLLLNLVRKLIPPVYFLFPLGTVSQVYFADKLGVDEGSLVYQALKAQDIVFFILIRVLYTNAVAVLFGLSDDDVASHRVLKWLSPDFRAALRGLDRLWGRVFDVAPVGFREDDGGSNTDGPASSPGSQRKSAKANMLTDLTVGESSNAQRLRRVALVVVWGVALYMEDYVNLFWLATRSGMSWPLFVFAHVLSMVVEFPKTRIKFQVILDVSNASTGAGAWVDILNNLGDTAWYEIAFVLVVGGLATIFVHGLHLHLVTTSACKFVARHCCPGRFRSRNSANCSPA